MTNIDAVLEELDEFFVTERRQPGDIDAKTIAEKYNLSINAARDRIKRIAKQHPDKFRVVVIREGAHTPQVLRKVGNG